MGRTKDRGVKSQKVVSSFSPRGRYFKKEPVRHEKIDRNGPCPCGSGKKYKNCCRKEPKGILARIRRFFSSYEEE